jgi:carbonic anhydrase/acetyltransferase-like protein (isoleucine patch superfamily)
MQREYKPDMSPTEVEITHPCWIHGEARAIGDRVTVGKQDAVDLQAMKRAKIVKTETESEE